MTDVNEDFVVRELDVYLCNGRVPEHTNVSNNQTNN